MWGSATAATLFVTTFGLVSLLWSLVDCTACPSMCTCRYKGGKETAECVGKRLAKLPTGLSRGIQVLDISRNSFEELPKEAFFHAGLLNLQKVFIAECKIRKIHDNAFSHLANLVELDLESNLLIAVPSETFVDYPELRRLNLNRNHIRRVESNAFVKLPSLAFLEMSTCFLEYIGPKAFVGLNNLRHLKLDGNKLTTLPADVGLPLKSLHSLDLFDNPWHCDCELRVLRNWLVDDKLPVNAPPICSKPDRLQGRALIDVKPDEYACEPRLLSTSLKAEAFVGENAVLTCVVQADPAAGIQWTRDGHVVGNNTRTVVIKGAEKQRHLVTEVGTTSRISYLSIGSVTNEDGGDYLCIAENVAGQVTVNVTLEVLQNTAEVSDLGNGHVAGITLGLIFISVVIIAFICIMLAKMKQQQSEEAKHLPLDKKQNLHLVNHVKFEVTKDRLEMTSVNSVHKPLCSVVNSNYNSNTPLQEKFCLDDGIDGAFRSSSLFYSMVNNKPDVVNFTCALSNPDIYDVDEKFNKKHAVVVNSDTFPVQKTNVKDVKNVEISTYSSPSSLRISRSGSRERLCDFVQLYEDAASAATADGSVSLLNGQRCTVDIEDDGTICGRRELCSRKIDYREIDNDRRTAPSDQDLDKEDLSLYGLPTTRDPHSSIIVAEESTTDDGYELNLLSKDGSNCWHEFGGESSVGGGGGAIGDGGNGDDVPSNKVNAKLNGGAYKRYGPLGNASGILKHANLHGRNYVPVLPPLPARHFAQARDSPDEGYEDEVEEEMDM